MKLAEHVVGTDDAVVGVFEASFSASEGAEEGAVIAALVRGLFAERAAAGLRVFVAEDEDGLSGAICFSALHYPDDTRRVMMLSPVAVRPDAQGKGVGQALIRFGLDQLRAEGTHVAVTYGDPNFYHRVGFQPVTEADLPPPYPLSHPFGWQAQSLTADALAPFQGTPSCAAPFADPAYW